MRDPEKPLYIYTAKNHPKRSTHFGHEFKITRAYKDIRDVVYHTGETGYVRIGEFQTVQQYNLEHYGSELEQIRKRLKDREATKTIRQAEEQARYAAMLERCRKVQQRLERMRKARIRKWNKEQTDYLHTVLKREGRQSV